MSRTTLPRKRVQSFMYFSLPNSPMKHRISRLLYTLFSISFCLTTYAQTDSTRISPWFYSVSATGFFRNNEYKEPFGTGYTLPGYRLSGTVGYQKDKWEVSLGGFLWAILEHKAIHSMPMGTHLLISATAHEGRTPYPSSDPFFKLKPTLARK